ncbi:MAG: AsmA family protein [Candidatus Zixiibacteriota bacterium]
MKKLLKILGWAIAIFLTLLVILVIGLKLFFPVEKAKALAIERGSQMLGRPIGVEDVDISLWGGLGIVLKNVTIGSPEGVEVGNLLEANTVDLKLQLFPLLSKKFRVDKLIIDHPRIVMVKSADGTNNYTFTFSEKAAEPLPSEQLPPETKAAAVAVSFNRLEISKGTLTYTDDNTKTRAYLAGLNLSTALKNPRSNFYQSSGTLNIDTVLVTSENKFPFLSLKLRYRADYDVTAGALTLNEADLSINEVDFIVNGVLSHAHDTLKGRAGIRSGTVAVKDLLSILPQEQLAQIDDYSVKGEFFLDASVEYDQSTKPSLTYNGTALLTNMTMSKKGTIGKLQFRKALVDFKPDNLRLNIEEGRFDGQPLKVHLIVDNFSDPVVTGALSGKCDLAYVKPFLPAKENHEIAGVADFDVKVSGRMKDPRNLNFSGSLLVKEGRYNSALVPKPLESFTLDVFFDNTMTHINKLAVAMPSGQVNLSGRVNNLVPYLMGDSSQMKSVSVPFAGQVEGTLSLSLFNSFLPPRGNPQLKGSLTVNMDLSGDLANPATLKPHGNLSITNASFTDSLLPEPIRAFETTLRLLPDTIVIEKAHVQFVSSDMALSGKLTDPLPYLLRTALTKSIDRSTLRKPFLHFELTSHHFDIDRLFPEAVPGSETNRAEMPKDSLSLLLLPDIDGKGTFQFDTVIYSRIEFTHLTGKAIIQDRKIKCYDVAGKVYSGEVTGVTTVDLNDFNHPRYTGEFQASQIEANDFVSRFTQFGGHLFGKVNINGSYEASGWEPEEFLNSLSMTSKADMYEGKLVTSGLLYSVIAGLAKKVGQTFEREQPLKGLNTNILVQNGKVRVDKLKARIDKAGDLELDGFYSFNGDIGYNGSILLSREWTQRLLSQGGLLSGLAGVLTDKSAERIKLPIAIGGTIDKPSVSFDYTALSKNAQDNLKKQAGDLLKDLFKKKDKK